jgi:hypothetical protein
MRTPENETIHGECPHNEHHSRKYMAWCIYTNTCNLDYRVGRLALVFALPASDEVPIPRVMTLVQRFSPIPETTNGASGFYRVKKLMSRGLPRFEVVATSQVARLCSLAPRIEGPAARGVEGNKSLVHYDQFYINTYRNPRDFLFVHAN